MNPGGFGTGQSAFNFGTPQQQPQQPSIFGTTGTGFGAPAATVAPSAFTFGTPQQPQQQKSLFGTSTSTAPGGFGMAPSAFNFATPQQQTQQKTSLFGTTGSTGAFGTSTAGTALNTSGFGTTQPAFNFNTPQQPGIFGASTGFGTGQTNFNFSTQQQPGLFPGLQQQQQQQPQIDPQQAFYQSLFQCNKFGDERDIVLANFNYLQACLGTGKGYYSQTLPPVVYTPSNPLYRCKAVGYAFMYANSNEDGLVSFEIKKSAEKVRSEESRMIATLQTFLNRQNIIFKIAGVKGTSEEQSMVNIYAEDQSSLRRIPATDLAAAINQPHLKPQLDTLGISNISAKVKPSPEQLKRYLENPPEGIDPRVWKQAQEDNPDPEGMIPTPVIGVDGLKKRIQAQESESEHHSARVALIQEECVQYQNRCSSIGAEIIQLKRKQAQLSLRLLSVIARLEIARKGVANLQPEEQELSRRLQIMDDEMNSPTEYKGRLKELLSHLRLQQHSGPVAKYTIDETSLHEIKEFLTIQQTSLKHLVETVKDDMKNLNLILDSTNDPKTSVHKDPFRPAKE